MSIFNFPLFHLRTILRQWTFSLIKRLSFFFIFASSRIRNSQFNFVTALKIWIKQHDSSHTRAFLQRNWTKRNFMKISRFFSNKFFIINNKLSVEWKWPKKISFQWNVGGIFFTEMLPNSEERKNVNTFIS